MSATVSTDTVEDKGTHKSTSAGADARATIEAYFDHLARKSGWEAYLADDMKFTSYSTPFKQLEGSATYIESTKRFYSLIDTVEVKQLIVDSGAAGRAGSACALTRYGLKVPGGPAFDCHVAEVFGMQDGRISSLEIYFDSAPFPKPPKPPQPVAS